MEALQGSCSDHLLLDSLWGEFNVCREIDCCEDTWYYIVLMFLFSRDILQYAEIATQAWHSSCNIHLDHCAKVIPITDLYMPTARMVGISSSPGRNMWAKALSSLLLSWELLLLVFRFYTFCGTEPHHIRTSPPAGLASWGRTCMLAIILGKAVCITRWLTGTAIYLKEKSPSSPPYVEISLTFFMPLDAHSCISSLSSSPIPISSEPSSLVEVCSSVRQVVSLWGCCKYVPGGPVSTWRGACLYQLLLTSKLNTHFHHVRWMYPAAQRWTES